MTNNNEPAGWVGDEPVYLRDYEQEARQAAEKELEDYRESRKQAWVNAGGTAGEFAQAWPRIKEDYLMEKTKGLSAEEKFRRSNLADMRL